MTKNLIQQAQEEGLEARKVLEEGGLDHEDRLYLFNLISSGNKGAVSIWLDALGIARKRLAVRNSAEGEGGPPELKD